MIEQILASLKALTRRVGRLETQGGAGRWVDWTPTVTQGVAVSVTVVEAKYCVIGTVCHVYANMTVTGAGSAGSTIRVSLPVAFAPSLTNSPAIGVWHYYDNGTEDYAGVLRADGTSLRAACLRDSGWLGVTPSFAAANTDEFSISATYRVA